MKNNTKIQCIHLRWLDLNKHEMPRVFIQLNNADETNSSKQIITYNFLKMYWTSNPASDIKFI